MVDRACTGRYSYGILFLKSAGNGNQNCLVGPEAGIALIAISHVGSHRKPFYPAGVSLFFGIVIDPNE